MYTRVKSSASDAHQPAHNFLAPSVNIGVYKQCRISNYYRGAHKTMRVFNNSY